MRIGDKVRIKEDCELWNELDPELEHTIVRWGKGQVQLAGKSKSGKYDLEHYVYFKDILEVSTKNPFRKGMKVRVQLDKNFMHYLDVDKVHTMVKVRYSRRGNSNTAMVEGVRRETGHLITQEVPYADITIVEDDASKPKEQPQLSKGDRVMVAHVAHPMHYLNPHEAHTMLETPNNGQTHTMIQGRHRSHGGLIQQTVPMEEIIKI